MNKFYWIIIVVFMLAVAGCGTVATPEWSARAQETRVAQASTAEHLTEIAPTATPTSTLTSTPLPTSTATPVPPTATPTAEVVAATATPVPATPTVAAVAAAGDPASGQQIFNTFYPEAQFPQGCATCHRVDSEERLIGPGLLNIGTRAASRVSGLSAEAYIHQSIVEPSAFLVPDYPDNLMPHVYGQILTEQQIQDLIAYLMTLK